ncbi:MAG TPA: RNA methyltransferase [Saprospiraceae bacterium]|nr:RNA methyltransferase [Saprospiraceae bacterium]MCB9328483.1 RNA methyltransferase [Lewinellaceae bacterium]HPK10899.1 RNA methyltransferase [Saprospiraceae bacterium]HPQ20439.1 RNA methyltransferase [Saprospiraceae bacterium]HRX28187.1 RNA methyltransferase [Saprospiraceae bacterium]
MHYVKDKRYNRILDVVLKRQLDLTVVLENVHDPHNIGAVMRTCDSVGVGEIYLIITDTDIGEENIVAGKNSSSGSRKWIKIHQFSEVETAIKHIRKKYQFLYGTHLSEDSESLFEMNLSDSVALVFGNERRGISNELQQCLDGNFLIPDYGFVQSLNISVACAVSLHEASRQRQLKGKYKNLLTSRRKVILDEYLKISRPMYDQKLIKNRLS